MCSPKMAGAAAGIVGTIVAAEVLDSYAATADVVLFGVLCAVVAMIVAGVAALVVTVVRAHTVRARRHHAEHPWHQEHDKRSADPDMAVVLPFRSRASRVSDTSETAV